MLARLNPDYVRETVNDPKGEQTASTQRKEAQGNFRAGEERRIVALLADYEMRHVSLDCCPRC